MITHKIAIGTSDGKVVNAHFGRATLFFIFEMNNENTSFIEVRVNEPGCSNLREPKGTMEDTIELIQDCDYVIVSQIGRPMKEKLTQAGIEALTIRDYVPQALKTLHRLIHPNQQRLSS